MARWGQVLLLALAIGVPLAACGGGGSDGGSTTANSTPTQEPTIRNGNYSIQYDTQHQHVGGSYNFALVCPSGTKMYSTLQPVSASVNQNGSSIISSINGFDHTGTIDEQGNFVFSYTSPPTQVGTLTTTYEGVLTDAGWSGTYSQELNAPMLGGKCIGSVPFSGSRV